MINKSWAFFPVVALVAALAVAGCGTGLGKTSSPPGRPTPAALRTDVINAVTKAGSVHIAGTVENSGQKYTVDMELTKSGGTSGTLSVGNGSFYVLSTGGHTYVELTAGFIKIEKMPSAACSMMCGKYLELSASEAKGLDGDLSMKSMFRDVTGSTFIFRYGGSATINGQPAWLMHGSDGSTAYVSTRGSHYPLRLIGSGNNQGQVDFTQWNSVKIPPAPPASKVVNMSQLGA